MFGRKKKTRLQQVQETVQKTARARVHDLSDVVEHAPEKLEDLKHAAGDALHGASEALHEAAARMAGAAQSAASALGARAETLKSKAETLHGAAAQSAHDSVSAASSTLQEQADSIAAAAHKMKKERKQQAQDFSEKAQRELKKKWKDAEREVAARAPEVTVESSGDKWLWLVVGIGIGAALGVLLAPDTGRRTRAILKSKLARGSGAAEDLGESVARRAQNLSQRVAGLAHEISHKNEDDIADDVTIADRVRTELGRLEKEHALERINVDSCEGVVTLRGPVKETKIADAIVAATQGVLGVREVKNELATEDSGEKEFVG